MSPATEQHFFCVRELAAELRVKPHAVLAWIRSGELAAIDVSSRPGVGRPRWRIPAAAVSAWQERRTAKPAPGKPKRRKRRPNAPADFVRYSDRM